MAVAGIAVGIARVGAEHAHLPVGRPAHDPVVGNIAPEQAIKITEPDRSLGEAAPFMQQRDPAAVLQQIPKTPVHRAVPRSSSVTSIRPQFKTCIFVHSSIRLFQVSIVMDSGALGRYN